MTNKATITGHKKMDEVFAKLEPAIQRKLMRDSLKKVNNEIIHPTVKKKIPIGQAKPWLGYAGGYWKRSIKKRAMKRSRKRFGYETWSKGRPGEKVPYHSGYPEFGTKTTNRPQHPMRKGTYQHYELILRKVMLGVRRGVVNLLRRGR